MRVIVGAAGRMQATEVRRKWEAAREESWRSQGGLQQDEAVAMVNVLCWKMGLKPVPVRWVRRTTKRAHYTPPKRYVQPLGYVSFSQPCEPWAVIHEVAHYTVQMRAPKLTRLERRAYHGLRGRRSQHGPAFVRAVKDLASVWYGDANLYPWAREYKSLRGTTA